MKRIGLTQGLFALVDDEDFDWLNKYKWAADVRSDKQKYALRRDKQGKTIRMHRDIMSVADGLVVDHINYNGLDNQRHNLRVCTVQQNSANSRPRSRNTTGYKGLTFVDKNKKWYVRMTVKGETKCLGYYKWKHKAAEVFNENALKFNGEFAHLNKIIEEEIAIEFMPHVIHGVRDKWKDQIAQIYFGDLQKRKMEPYVYFEVNRYKDGWLVVYNFSHRHDYSLNGMNIIRKWDSHHLDFEGLLKYISLDGEVLWTATRSHYQLLFMKGDSKIVYIEPESHAIKPDTGFRGWENQDVISKDKFKFVDMKANKEDFEIHIWPVFRRFGIDRWQDWNDWKVERKFGRVRTAGLLFKDPAKFYKYARSCSIVKGV